MAIGALVVSLAGWAACGLVSWVGIILGVIALRQIRESGDAQEGRGMAIAGIVIGAVTTVGWLLYVGFWVFVIAASS